MKSKETSLREKEVVIQKLMNNLNNREGELKVKHHLTDKLPVLFYFPCWHWELFFSFEFERRLGINVHLAYELEVMD